MEVLNSNDVDCRDGDDNGGRNIFDNYHNDINKLKT